MTCLAVIVATHRHCPPSLRQCMAAEIHRAPSQKMGDPDEYGLGGPLDGFVPHRKLEALWTSI